MKTVFSFLLTAFTFVVVHSQGYAETRVTQTQQPEDIVIEIDGSLPLEQRGGNFTLYGVNGAVSLADFSGKVVAIYFGYSKCPDVCPTNLAILGSAMKQMTEAELNSFQAVFVSVDPGRDSPEHLAEYTRFFHPEMIGVSAAPNDLNPVVAQYGAYYEIQRYSNSEMLYGIDHTSETYIVGKDGKLAAILAHASPRDEVLEAIQLVMQAELQRKNKHD